MNWKMDSVDEKEILAEDSKRLRTAAAEPEDTGLDGMETLDEVHLLRFCNPT